MAALKTLQTGCAKLAGYAVIGTCFAIPLSTSIMDICSALVVLFWLLSGKAMALPRLLGRNPVAFVATTLFLYFAVAMLYSPAEIGKAFSVLMKYRELMLLPIVITLASDNELLIRRAENAFLAGAVLLMLVSFLMAASLLPLAKYGYSLLFHITHSFFMATLAFWSFQRAIDHRRYRPVWILIFFLATANIVFITPGRTGMVSYAVLMVLACMQRLNLKGKIAGCLVLFLLIPACFYTSKNFSSRIQLALQDIIHYEPGLSRSSLGMRLDWWNNSVELILERPLIGNGTGSFAIKQQELIKGTKTKPTDNPHSEYLFIGVQLGLTGVFLFLILLLSQWLYASRLSRHRKFLIQGIVLTMATGCIMNSFLFDSHQGHFFAFLSALFLSAPKTQASHES
jgi:O-antigen ligase